MVLACLIFVTGLLTMFTKIEILVEAPMEVMISKDNVWGITDLPYKSCHRTCNNCVKSELLGSVNQGFLLTEKGLVNFICPSTFLFWCHKQLFTLLALQRTGRNQCSLLQDGYFHDAGLQGTGMLLCTLTWGFITF